jgi:hypothetical protein
MPKVVLVPGQSLSGDADSSASTASSMAKSMSSLLFAIWEMGDFTWADILPRDRPDGSLSAA